MTNVSASRVLQIREQVTIPGTTWKGWGATAGDMHIAIAMLENRWEAVYGSKPKSDDWFRIWAGDDEVVLFFLLEEALE